MSKVYPKSRVGEMRPSQMLTTYGIGAIIDLPHLATLVMGLEDWSTAHAPEIGEERLLAAVRAQLGDQVERLRGTPMELERDSTNPYDHAEPVGVPVATFPRWLVCPFCRLLAPVSSGLFKLKVDDFNSDRSSYVHDNCNVRGSKPNALPARFLVACQGGHLDDFPWIWYVHKGNTHCAARLRLRVFGVSGEAADLNVECETCEKRRSMADAFGQDNAFDHLKCNGRWPHLREYAEAPCAERPRAILLGASNFWFPVSLSALAIPAETDKLGRLVESQWVTLSKVTSLDRLTLLRELNQLLPFSAVPDATLWEAIERYRNSASTAPVEAPTNLRAPEWKAFSDPDPHRETKDFRLRRVAPPEIYAGQIDKVVLVERLREVQALIGFTRIVSPGEMSEVEEVPLANRAPLSRRSPQWVPASEVRGEGIFIQFNEDTLEEWEARPAIQDWTDEFYKGHVEFRRSRNIVPPGNYFPGLRYVLLHSFSHILMRRLAIECGYTAASIAERIYSLPRTDENGPMAGVLIYTAAADSEGTLGGLVSLGEPAALGRLLDLALEEAQLCSSDPLCTEHRPSEHSLTLHGAACHSCLFAPETACERGNKYLDRSVLVEPVFPAGRSFFGHHE